MSAGFTIDGTVYPAESGTEFSFDRNLSVEAKPAKRVLTFGDGYSSHQPIGPTVRQFSVSFTNRPTTDIDKIVTYFELLGGSSFAIDYFGESIKVLALSWNRTWVQEDINSLSVTLKEYYDS